MNMLCRRWQRKGPFTAAANTAFTCLLDPLTDSGRVVVTRLTITNGATVQTMSVMQVLGISKVAADAATGQAVIKIANAEATALGIATGDWIAVRAFDGTLVYGTVTVGAADSGGAGYTNLTFASNLTKAIKAGAKLYWFDVPASHEQVSVPASATTVYQDADGYFGASEMGWPILIHVNNITNAATINQITCPIIEV